MSEIIEYIQKQILLIIESGKKIDPMSVDGVRLKTFREILNQALIIQSEGMKQ